MTSKNYTSILTKKEEVDAITYSQVAYDQFLVTVAPSLTCPHCENSLQLKVHGRYWRYLYFLEGECQILLTRMRCLSCTKTFVVLPPEIIPHKRYLATIVITAVKEACASSAYQVEHWSDLSQSLVTYWLKQFNLWYLAWALIKEVWQVPAKGWLMTYALMDPWHRFMQVQPTHHHRYHCLTAYHTL